MTYSKLLGTLPMVIILILVIFSMIKFNFRLHKKLMYRVLWNISWTSFLFIFLFTFVYIAIMTVDLQTLVERKVRPITFDMLSSFQGISSDYPLDSYGIFVFNLFLYSVSVYFHIPFEYQMIGPGQSIVVLEGVFGAIVPIVMTILTFTKVNGDNKEQIDLFKIYLNRGWNVLRWNKTSTQNIISVDLLSSDKTQIETLFVSNSLFIEDLIKHFSVKWENIGYDMIPYFARLLEEPLRQEDYKHSSKASLLFFKKNKEEVGYYKEFYEFLIEIQHLNHLWEYTRAINHVINLLEKKLGINIDYEINEDINKIKDGKIEVKPDE